MENEQLNQGQKINVDDLKFMRSVMEKTYRKIKPETHDAIMWGLICMVGYISIHFLSKYGLSKWIAPLYMFLISLGILGTVVSGFIWIRRQKKKGFIPKVVFQLTGIAISVMFPIIFWDMMGLFKNVFCQAGFIYPMGISVMLGAYGALYSKAGYLGSAIIFAGMLLAFLAREQACPMIILGISTGLGIIIPAIIADRSYRKQEKENA